MRILPCAILLFLSLELSSQYNHTNVLPNLTESSLLQELVHTFKPDFVLSYGRARDTLFSKVYAQENTLTCIYTGHTIPLDPDADPTISAYQNGSPTGINTEHSYPQSKGARNGNAKADMHHLFPTRTPVNEARSADPYADIPDEQTTQWFIQDQVTGNVPTNNIDLYSEDTSNLFEPKESMKGNIARAIFYFYTMYQTQADAADPNFFEMQKSTLCAWHLQDPVDSLEWHRNQIIAQHQDDKPNPFILDCSLPARSYCIDLDISCDFISSTQTVEKELDIHAFPNPSNHGFNLIIEESEVQIKIFRIDGTLLNSDYFQKGNHFILDTATHGIYIMEIQDEKGNKKQLQLIKY